MGHFGKQNTHANGGSIFWHAYDKILCFVIVLSKTLTKILKVFKDKVVVKSSPTIWECSLPLHIVNHKANKQFS
jgi:hypothetical protein